MSYFKYIKNDNTRFCSKGFLGELGEGAKIICIYAFNADEVVNLCEMTPSYYMRYCGLELIAPDLNEVEYESAFEMIQNGYSMDDCDYYTWCSNVKNAMPVPCYADCLEDVVEYYQGNPGGFT